MGIVHRNFSWESPWLNAPALKYPLVHRKNSPLQDGAPPTEWENKTHVPVTTHQIYYPQINHNLSKYQPQIIHRLSIDYQQIIQISTIDYPQIIHIYYPYVPNHQPVNSSLYLPNQPEFSHSQIVSLFHRSHRRFDEFMGLDTSIPAYLYGIIWYGR